MKLSLISLVYFIAFSHAVLMAVALWRQTQKGQSGRILAVLLAVFGYKMFEAGVTYSDLYRVIPHTLDWLPGVVLIIGPLFYGYIRSVSGEQSFSKLQWFIHLIPAVLLIAYNSPQVFVSASTKVSNITHALSYEGPRSFPMAIIVLLVAMKTHLAIYLIKSWKILTCFESQANQLRADNSFLILQRHKQLCLALIALEVLWVVLFLLQQSLNFFALSYVSTSWLIFMACIILAMGYYGLKQPTILFSDAERTLVHDAVKSDSEQVAAKQITADQETSKDDSVQIKEVADSQRESDNVIQIERNTKNTKYQLSTISEKAAGEIASLIDKAMIEKQLFLDDKLTLTSLSAELSLKPHMVSQVINQSMKLNFYQLVNQHRVEYAIVLLGKQNSGWSVERIAYESGFGNRVTFNNAFKSLKGCSPSVYKKQLKQAI